VGHYDKQDVACNGDPTSVEDAERMACVYRDRCVGLGLYANEVGQAPNSFVALAKVVDSDQRRREYAFARKDGEGFKTLLALQVQRYGVRDGRPTHKMPVEVEPPAPPRRTKQLRKARPPTPAQQAQQKDMVRLSQEKNKEQLEDAWVLVSWFVKNLVKHTEPKIKVQKSRARTSEGEVYIVDKYDTSKYLAMYGDVRAKKVGVALIYPRPKLAELRIHFPVPVDAFPSDLAERLGLKPEVGRFCSKTKNLDRELIAVAAETLADFLNRKVIDLGANRVA
jgi:hypothetical protein